jgi:hypothetical protein
MEIVVYTTFGLKNPFFINFGTILLLAVSRTGLCPCSTNYAPDGPILTHGRFLR